MDDLDFVLTTLGKVGYTKDWYYIHIDGALFGLKATYRQKGTHSYSCHVSSNSIRSCFAYLSANITALATLLFAKIKQKIPSYRNPKETVTPATYGCYYPDATHFARPTGYSAPACECYLLEIWLLPPERHVFVYFHVKRPAIHGNYQKLGCYQLILLIAMHSLTSVVSELVSLVRSYPVLLY